MPTAGTDTSLAMPKFFSSSMRRLRSGSFITTAPPSAVWNSFVAWKLNMVASP